MARRVVSALETIGSGERDVEWIEDLLDPQLNRGVTAAPPEGLILMDVKYPGVRWIEDTYSKRMASERLSKEMKRRTALAEAVGEIRQAML
jgi:Pseudouridylate synthase